MCNANAKHVGGPGVPGIREAIHGLLPVGFFSAKV